jgi:hypothetical protein
MVKDMREQNKGLFRVCNGRIRQGRDPILSLLEIPTANGIVHDLLLTCELPDGEYSMDSDGITRGPEISMESDHG